MKDILDDIVQDLITEESLRSKAASRLIAQAAKLPSLDETKYKEILWKDAKNIAPSSGSTTPILPIDQQRVPTDAAKQEAKDFLKGKGFSPSQADEKIQRTIAQG